MGAYGTFDLRIKWPKEPGKRMTSIVLTSQNAEVFKISPNEITCFVLFIV
jgi:hypothetical protein